MSWIKHESCFIFVSNSFTYRSIYAINQNDRLPDISNKYSVCIFGKYGSDTKSLIDNIDQSKPVIGIFNTIPDKYAAPCTGKWDILLHIYQTLGHKLLARDSFYDIKNNEHYNNKDFAFAVNINIRRPPNISRTLQRPKHIFGRGIYADDSGSVDISAARADVFVIVGMPHSGKSHLASKLASVRKCSIINRTCDYKGQLNIIIDADHQTRSILDLVDLILSYRKRAKITIVNIESVLKRLKYIYMLNMQNGSVRPYKKPKCKVYEYGMYRLNKSLSKKKQVTTLTYIPSLDIDKPFYLLA
jgi:hypothetical protein